MLRHHARLLSLGLPLVLWLALALSALSACLTTLPLDDDDPVARVIVMWDPLACVRPHRVVVELEHDDGANVSSSVPCTLGSLTIDLPRWGVYFGVVYGWELGELIRRTTKVTLAVDAPLIYWRLAAPP